VTGARRGGRDDLTPAALQRGLCSAVFGHRVVYYATIGSTNDRALELAAAGEAEGTLVLAEEQTRGRGRRDRSWASPAGAGIYASLLLRPGIPAARAPLLTLLAAVAVARGLRGAAGVAAAIKWPNDVVVGRRKIAGILAESRGGEPTIRDLVVGIGVNVNQRRDDFPEEVRDTATSVRIETGRAASRAPILAAILEGFERGYTRLLRDGAAPLLREWESLAAIPRGGRIVVEGPAGSREGLVAGLDDEGALLLQTAGGSTERIAFGAIVRATWP
jgi:BirA family biotin operon repressor/biotin-[acetyl-CoA-carboxylase] ligase